MEPECGGGGPAPSGRKGGIDCPIGTGVCRPPGVMLGVARRDRRDAMMADVFSLTFSSAFSQEQRVQI